MNYETTKVLIKNTSNQLLHILRCQKLGHVVNIRYDNYFLANQIHVKFSNISFPSFIILQA